MKAGYVVNARLSRRVPGGREQQGLRPCIVVSNPADVGWQRYPTLLVVPLTTTDGNWVKKGKKLYCTLKATQGGVKEDCIAMLDQMQVIDVSRIVGKLGELTSAELEPVRFGVRAMFADLLEGV
jgi:mRNA interferase MazF